MSQAPQLRSFWSAEKKDHGAECVLEAQRRKVQSLGADKDSTKGCHVLPDTNSNLSSIPIKAMGRY